MPYGAVLYIFMLTAFAVLYSRCLYLHCYLCYALYDSLDIPISMEVSYIPIAKARGFTTHWIKRKSHCRFPPRPVPIFPKTQSNKNRYGLLHNNGPIHISWISPLLSHSFPNTCSNRHQYIHSLINDDSHAGCTNSHHPHPKQCIWNRFKPI